MFATKAVPTVLPAWLLLATSAVLRISARSLSTSISDHTHPSLSSVKRCYNSNQIRNMTTSRIVTLAKEVEVNTTKLDEYLETKNLPRPSFDADAPLMYQLPPDIAAAQEALTAALDELYWLNQGPIQTVVAKSVSRKSNHLFMV